MRRQWNPILLKEMRIGARTIRYPILILLYDLLLAVIAFMLLYQAHSLYVMNGQVQANYVVYLFRWLGWIQFFMMCILIPILSANAIAGERERQTLNMLLTTTLGVRAIVRGKLLSSIGIVMILVASSVPIFSLGLLYGGIHWYELLGMLGLLLILGTVLAAVGICCSAYSKRAIGAVILNYILEILWIGGGYFLWRFLQGIAAQLTQRGHVVELCLEMAVLTANPMMVFSQFVDSCLDGLANEEQYLTDVIVQEGRVDCVSYLQSAMVPVGCVCFLILSYILYRVASHRLNPLYEKRSVRRKKRPLEECA